MVNAGDLGQTTHGPCVKRRRACAFSGFATGQGGGVGVRVL